MVGLKGARVGDLSCDGCCGCYQRSGKNGPCSGTLAAFEIAVGGGYGEFSRRNLVIVHREACGASRLTQFEPRFCKDDVNALGTYLTVDAL